MTGRDIHWLQEMVGDDLDSWFSSSLCCCDNCYLDFKRRWPGTVRRDPNFEDGVIPLDCFLEGAKRIPRVFSAAQLSTLRHYVLCGRCGDYVEHNLWAFEHPFDGAEAFEGDLDELEAVAQRTPFLLLEHAFPKRVLEEVRRLGATAQPVPAPERLFRARRALDVAVVVLDAFGPPPPSAVREGRYNHAGGPMLYLAGDEETAFREVREPGVDYLIGQLLIPGAWRVLDLVDIEEDETPAWPLLNLLSRSALGAAPRTGTGWMAKEYAFTRFVGDCAKAAGFQAIRYGSTKGPGDNYVLLEPDNALANATLIGTARRTG